MLVFRLFLFLNPLNINHISNSSVEDTNANNGNKSQSKEEEELTWIHELFQGILVNETKCLNCETVKI